MAAGQGFKTFTTGEVLTAGDVNGYLMQGVLVFATAAARNSAITSPQEGQFAFTKDTNGLWYYDGAAWVASGATGDIEGVTAGVGITGGGTSGTVTVTNDMATTITAAGDIVVGTGSGTYDNLPIGTTNQILTADTSVSPYKVKWATPAGGGSMTLLSTTSLSGTSTTISSIAGGYRNLYIYGQDIVTTSGTADLRLVWNANINGTYGTIIAAGAYAAFTTTRISNNPGITDPATGRATLSTSGGCQFVCNFLEYTETTGFRMVNGYITPTYSEDNITFAALNDTTTNAITSFKVTTAAGTASLTGTIKIYGVN